MEAKAHTLKAVLARNIIANMPRTIALKREWGVLIFAGTGCGDSGVASMRLRGKSVVEKVQVFRAFGQTELVDGRARRVKPAPGRGL